MQRSRIVAAMLSGAFLLLSPPALAKSTPADAIQTDPDSPAGVEYALPLQTARQDAAGGRDAGSDASGGGSAPLFGEGIGSDSGSAPATGSRAADAKLPAAGLSNRPARAGGDDPTAAADPGGGLHTGVTITLGALLLLVLGGLIGLVLRRGSGHRVSDSSA